jgi:CubicO group peptidase (beta-lactamase class C family)
MKKKKHLHLFQLIGLNILYISVIVLWSVSTQAQNVSITKGYGNAVYQGLLDDVFLRKWLVLGPMPVSDKPGEPGKDVLKSAFNNDLLTVADVDKKKNIQPVEYLAKKYAWQYVESKSDTIKLNKILGDTNFVFCYALAEIIAAEPSKTLVGLGSDDGVKMWINGKEIHVNFIDRAITPDEDVFEISLNKGSNQILLRIQNTRGEYGFCLRPVSNSAISNLLLKSSESGDFDNVKTLLNYSPDINKKNETGLTSWQLATMKGRTEIADYLKQKGAVTTYTFPPLNVYVDSLFAKISGKKAPGASVLVAQNGKILLEKGFGLADIGYGIPASPVTKFRIGSITKQFIATAILKLQEDGKINVEDKLSKFIPDFPRGDEVTIRHLLTHTSGIHSFTNRPDFLKTATVKTTEEEMIDSIKKDKFDFNPGEQFQYNNSGFFILGYIIEKITGKPYGEYLKEIIFTPLGMKNTGVHTSQLILENEATGYAINNGKFEKSLNWDMSRAGGAGSLYSTVEDLYLWNEALFNGKVLTSASLKAAFTPVILNNGKKPQEMDYGYGWAITDLRNLKFINHGGGLHGFLSHITRQPEDNLTVVVLTNCIPPQDNTGPDHIAYAIAEYLLWQKMNKQQSYTADTTLSAEELKEYEGRYDYGNAMVLTVIAEGDRLFAQMTGQSRFQIFPKGNDEFYWKVVEARIRFLRNENHEITHATHYQGGRELDVSKLPEIKTIQLNSSVLEKYVGKYEYEPNVIITITSNDGRLFMQAEGQNKIEFFPLSDTTFAAKEIDGTAKFIPDGENSYKIELRIGPNVRTIGRVK